MCSIYCSCASIWIVDTRHTVTSLEDIKNILDIYTLEEVIELNDASVEDVLFFLVEERMLELPDPEPL